MSSADYSRVIEQTGVSTAGGTRTRYYYEFDLPVPYTLPYTGTYYLGLHLGTTTALLGKAWEVIELTGGTERFFAVQCSSIDGTTGLCNNFGTWAVQGPPLTASKSQYLAFQLTAVPEPGTLLLLGTGLVGLGAVIRRRRRP